MPVPGVICQNKRKTQKNLAFGNWEFFFSNNSFLWKIRLLYKLERNFSLLIADLGRIKSEIWERWMNFPRWQFSYLHARTIWRCSIQMFFICIIVCIVLSCTYLTGKHDAYGRTYFVCSTAPSEHVKVAIALVEYLSSLMNFQICTISVAKILNQIL